MKGVGRKVGAIFGLLLAVGLSLSPGLAAERGRKTAPVPSVEQFRARMKVHARRWLGEMAESYVEEELSDKGEEEQKAAVEETVAKYMEVVDGELGSGKLGFITEMGRDMDGFEVEWRRKEMLEVAEGRQATQGDRIFELEFLCEADAIAFAGLEDELDPFLKFLVDLPFERAKKDKKLAGRDYLFGCILLVPQAREAAEALSRLTYPLQPSRKGSERLSMKFWNRTREVWTKYSSISGPLTEEGKKLRDEVCMRYAEALIFTEENSEKTLGRVDEEATTEKARWKADRYARLRGPVDLFSLGVEKVFGSMFGGALAKEYLEGHILADELGMELVARGVWLEATMLTEGWVKAVMSTFEDMTQRMDEEAVAEAFLKFVIGVEGKEGVERARLEAKLAASRNNLKQVGLAMHLYSTDYEERFPEGLRELHDKNYLVAESILVSPATEWGYTYFRIPIPLSKMSPVWMVAWGAKPTEDGRRAVLHVDGHVTLRTEEEFQKQLAKQLKEMEEVEIEGEIIEGKKEANEGEVEGKAAERRR